MYPIIDWVWSGRPLLFFYQKKSNFRQNYYQLYWFISPKIRTSISTTYHCLHLLRPKIKSRSVFHPLNKVKKTTVIFNKVTLFFFESLSHWSSFSFELLLNDSTKLFTEAAKQSLMLTFPSKPDSSQMAVFLRGHPLREHFYKFR